MYRGIERLLARRTDQLIAVSDEVRDELVAMGVAPRSKFEVMPLGFDLSPFAVGGTERQRLREAVRKELGIPLEAQVVTLIARLVPIKRVDRFLSIALALRSDDIRFLVVGDGELREQLHRSPEAMSLNGRLVWAGFRRDMPAVCFASDVIVQTSDNEGTPVALIEAQAAGVPVVSTRVGGTASAVGDAGTLCEAGDDAGLVAAVRGVLEGPDVVTLAAARETVRVRFDLDRLVLDVNRAYKRLSAPPATPACGAQAQC
jgi:glycosyltransferase involved in cell wall biosynthesis